jgi:hypothetical protein
MRPTRDYSRWAGPPSRTAEVHTSHSPMPRLSRHSRFDHATPFYPCPPAPHDWRDRVEINEITEAIIGAAIAVHRDRGPGLLESACKTCSCSVGSAWKRERPCR